MAPQSGRWTQDLCPSCGNLRTMPEGWSSCVSCMIGSSGATGARRLVKKAYRLIALSGSRVRERRVWLALEVEPFCELADISHPTLGKVERGEPVREATAFKIARALDTTIEELSG